MNSQSSATIHEAYRRRGALPANLQGLERSMRLFGPAYPVATAMGDNLWLHRALEAAERGVILVVAMIPLGDRPNDGRSAGPGREFGYWGELMTMAASKHGIRGLLIDGHVRDRDAIVESGLPVFCRGVCLRGTTKNLASAGALGQPLEIGGVPVAAGDLVVGDADGVVVVASSEAAAVLQRARRLAARERKMAGRILGGESTLRILGLEER